MYHVSYFYSNIFILIKKSIIIHPTDLSLLPKVISLFEEENKLIEKLKADLSIQEEQLVRNSFWGKQSHLQNYS